MENRRKQNRGRAKQPGNVKHTKRAKYPLGYLVPLILVLAIIPEIIYLKIYNSGLTKYDWYQGGGNGLWDFFLQSKMMWLYLSFGMMICIMLFMVLSEEMKLAWTRMLVPLFLYGGLCILSTVTSIDRGYSFHGIYEQFEPVWMLLGYVLIVYYAFTHFQAENAIRRVMPWFIGGVTVMSIYGMAQVLKHDPLSYKWFQQLVIPNPSFVGKVAFRFEKGMAYLSLYNPNYVGYYAVLVVPILMALLFHTKKLAWRICYGVLVLAVVAILFASQSRAGIMALLAALVVILLCMRRVFFKNWKVTAAIFAVAVLGFIGVNVINHNILINRMKNMFQMSKESNALEKIVTNKDVAITYNGNVLHMTVEPKDDDDLVFHLEDQDGKQVAYTLGDGTDPNKIADERFPFTFYRSNTDSFTGFVVTIPKTEWVDGVGYPSSRDWQFTNEMKAQDTTYYVKGLSHALFHMTEVEKGPKFLEEHPQIANGRGYLWAKSIMTLKKYFWLGSGPDTFLIAFPNWDYVGMANARHDGEVVTKPHCLYLQIAVQTGVPSLIAYLVFFIWYLVSSLRLYWKRNYDSYLSKLGVAAFAAVFGYLVAGLTNDSCIAIAPVFYAITGMGLGINHYLRKEQEA